MQLTGWRVKRSRRAGESQTEAQQTRRLTLLRLRLLRVALLVSRDPSAQQKLQATESSCLFGPIHLRRATCDTRRENDREAGLALPRPTRPLSVALSARLASPHRHRRQAVASLRMSPAPRLVQLLFYVVIAAAQNPGLANVNKNAKRGASKPPEPVTVTLNDPKSKPAATPAPTVVQVERSAAKVVQHPGKTAAANAIGPNPNDASGYHDNGSSVQRYEFHSELVHVDKDLPHAVKVYRTMMHDKTTRGLPSCDAVDGWFLSLNGLPFWQVEHVDNGLPHYAAACDYAFKDWPDGKSIRDEVPRLQMDMNVVFSKVEPPGSKEEL